MSSAQIDAGLSAAVSNGAAHDPLAAAVALIGDIAAAADEIEETRRIPPELFSKLHEARLCRMLLPRSFGGDEIDPGRYLRVIETVARADASVAWNLFVANSAALLAAHLEPATAQTIFGPANALVAWAAERDGCGGGRGGYRVSGRWDFASGCRNATWMGVHCRVREANGDLRQNQYGQSAVVSMLFPAAQATLLDTWDTIGLRGTASDAYTVQDLFVAEAFTGTREAPEARREPGALYAFPMQGIYAVGVAGVALGIAGEMLTAFRALASEKTPRGYTRLSDSAAVQAGIARSEVRLGAAHAYLQETLAEIYQRAGSQGAIGVDDRARVRLGTSNAIQGAI